MKQHSQNVPNCDNLSHFETWLFYKIKNDILKHSAAYANKIGLCESKGEGYLTCPFDLMVSNYIRLCECIKDDFRYFCDLNYLTLRECPKMKALLGDNQNDDELWIYNTYYNFAFNHESPDHGKYMKLKIGLLEKLLC